MKSFEVEGYTIKFEETEKIKRINQILSKNNETTNTEYGNSNHKDLSSDEDKISREVTEHWLCRYYKAYVSRELIEKEKLKKNDVLTVINFVLYSDNENEIERDEATDLLLLDDETGECISVYYVNKLKQINEIKDDDIRQYEYEKISVDQRCIIEYKVGEKIVSGVVLTIGLDNYHLIDKEDYFAVLSGKKESKDVVSRIVSDDHFASLLCRLDRTYIRFNEYILNTCKTIIEVKK